MHIIEKIINGTTKKDKIELSFVIVDFNTYDFIVKLLLSIDREIKKMAIQIIIVTNSESKSSQLLRDLCKKNGIDLLVLDENVGFGRSNNIAVSYCSSRNICLINPDIELLENAEDYFRQSIKTLEKNKNIGILSAKLLNQDRTLQKSWGKLPIITFENRIRLYEEGYCEYPWIIGAFYIMEKKYFEEIGGFDSNIFMYAEDLDLCIRIRKDKKKIIMNKKFEVIHYGGSSLISFDEKEKFRKKYYLERLSLYYVLKKNYSLCYANMYYKIRLILNYICFKTLKREKRKEIFEIYKKIIKK